MAILGAPLALFLMEIGICVHRVLCTKFNVEQSSPSFQEGRNSKTIVLRKKICNV